MSQQTAKREVILKTQEEIDAMRESGRIIAKAHQAMREAVRPGVSTKELDTIAETVLRDHGATPAFLNYQPTPTRPPYPATITASINNELVHGVPYENRILQEGDIISLDVGCFYNGFVGDAAFSMGVGEIAPAAQRLLEITEKALWKAIEVSVLGNKISDVAKATQKFAAKHGYSVAREYTGHGVGRSMHEAPSVPNWWHGKKRKKNQHAWDDYELQVGMTYAIEPMLIAGRNDLEELDDGWTVVTKDGSLCCHTEHSIAITEGEPLILTLP